MNEDKKLYMIAKLANIKLEKKLSTSIFRLSLDFAIALCSIAVALEFSTAKRKVRSESSAESLSRSWILKLAKE